MSLASMGGLGYDVTVPALRRRVVPQLETQAQHAVAAVRSKRPPRPLPFTPPPIRRTHPL
jgi:hypothetical protein